MSKPKIHQIYDAYYDKFWMQMDFSIYSSSKTQLMPQESVNLSTQKHSVIKTKNGSQMTPQLKQVNCLKLVLQQIQQMRQQCRIIPEPEESQAQPYKIQNVQQFETSQSASLVKKPQQVNCINKDYVKQTIKMSNSQNSFIPQDLSVVQNDQKRQMYQEQMQEQSIVVQSYYNSQFKGYIDEQSEELQRNIKLQQLRKFQQIKSKSQLFKTEALTSKMQVLEEKKNQNPKQTLAEIYLPKDNQISQQVMERLLLLQQQNRKTQQKIQKLEFKLVQVIQLNEKLARENLQEKAKRGELQTKIQQIYRAVQQSSRIDSSRIEHSFLKNSFKQ